MTVRLDKTWWTRTQYRIYHSASVDQELIFFNALLNSGYLEASKPTLNPLDVLSFICLFGNLPLLKFD